MKYALTVDRQGDAGVVLSQDRFPTKYDAVSAARAVCEALVTLAGYTHATPLDYHVRCVVTPDGQKVTIGVCTDSIVHADDSVG